MRKLLSLITLLCMFLGASSQKNESFYVFNADWKPTKIDSAHYLLHIHRIDDTCWQWDYYNFTGPMLRSEQYDNKDGGELNGIKRLYHANGLMDSIVTYRKGKRNGDTYKLSPDSLKYITKYVYSNDSLISTTDLTASKDDTLKYADEKESEYPGGLKQWGRYLNKNLKYPDRALSGNIQGSVSVMFIVDKDGAVILPFIARSVEYSLDEESLRIIRTSGKWIPGFQNGRYIKTYKIQPVYFRLQ